MKPLLVPNFRGCKLIQVIECVTLEGEGTQQSPARLAYTYTDLDGNVLAKREWPEGLVTEEPK